MYSFQKPASLPGRTPRYEEAPAHRRLCSCRRSLQRSRLRLRSRTAAESPRSRFPAPPHERRWVSEGLCAEQRPQRYITGYLRCSGFLQEPHQSSEASHKINTCLLCYEETGDTARKTLPLVDLSYLHIYLPRRDCFIFVRGYIQTKSLTAIAFLNCKVFF